MRKCSQWGVYHSSFPFHAVTRSHLSGGWWSSPDPVLSFNWHLSFLTHEVFYKVFGVVHLYPAHGNLDSRHKRFCYEIMQVRITIYLNVFLSLHPSLLLAHVYEVTRVKWKGTFHSPWTDRQTDNVRCCFSLVGDRVSLSYEGSPLNIPDCLALKLLGILLPLSPWTVHKKSEMYSCHYSVHVFDCMEQRQAHRVWCRQNGNRFPEGCGKVGPGLNDITTFNLQFPHIYKSRHYLPSGDVSRIKFYHQHM